MNTYSNQNENPPSSAPLIVTAIFGWPIISAVALFGFFTLWAYLWPNLHERAPKIALIATGHVVSYIITLFILYAIINTQRIVTTAGLLSVALSGGFVAIEHLIFRLVSPLTRNMSGNIDDINSGFFQSLPESTLATFISVGTLFVILFVFVGILFMKARKFETQYSSK